MNTHKIPKNTKDYEWTNHVVRKMLHYRLSEGLVKRIVRYPARREEGIAPGTIAVMRRAVSKKPQELWVMYAELGQSLKSKVKSFTSPKRRIISAWRYPGVSPKGKNIPIPDDIREELEEGLI